MRPSILPTLTGNAASAGTLRRSRFFIARPHRQHEDGLGIAPASNAGERGAVIMAQMRKKPEMPASENGAKTTQVRLLRQIKGNISNRNTDFHLKMSRRCVTRKILAAQYAIARQVACSLTTAIPRATSGRCFARPATLSLAGMRKRQAPFSSSRNTSRSTADNQPCHGDVLLRLANGGGE